MITRRELIERELDEFCAELTDYEIDVLTSVAKCMIKVRITERSLAEDRLRDADPLVQALRSTHS